MLPGTLRRVLVLGLMSLAILSANSAAQNATNTTVPPVADVVFWNARFYTMQGDPPATIKDEPHVQAIAARGGRIIAMGSRAEVQAHVRASTQVHDLGGAVAVPGLVDAHAHMRNLGRFLNTVNLIGTGSYEEVVAKVRAAAAELPKGTWIRGRGWDQNDWPMATFPDHRLLSEAVPDHPVWIRRVDGHAALANAVAMQLAGIEASTPSPAGGRILRRPDRTPTGVFVDAAEELVSHVIPAADQATRVRWFGAAMQHMLALGLTGMHDAGVTPAQMKTYRWLLERNELPLRIYAMVDARPDSEDRQAYDAALQRGPEAFDPTGHLAQGCVKFAMDGALGSRGAALLEPYSDEPDQRGLPQYTYQELHALFLPLHRAGFQIAVHAIGDAANRTCLDVFEAIQQAAPRPDCRHRIEHAQVLDPSDIDRFATLGVIPSMQATHCTSDMPWAPQRLGSQRIAGAYAWRELRNTGVILPGGSDAPVESIDPMLGIYAAVTRQDVSGNPPQGWAADQCLSRSEAVRAFTSWAAEAAFAEDDLGTLAVGKWLDLSVFDRDVMLVPASELLEAQVRATVIGGEVLYQAP